MKQNKLLIAAVCLWGIVFLLLGKTYQQPKKVSGAGESLISMPDVNEQKEAMTLAEWKKINPATKYVLSIQDDDLMRVLPVIESDDAMHSMTYNIYGEKDSSGSIFTDYSEYEPENLVIYGHSSIHNENRLTFLEKMKDRSYFDRLSSFQLETEQGILQCKVLSFASYDLEDESITTLWAMSQFESPQERSEMFLSTVPYHIQSRKGVIDHGQQIITLVTCDLSKRDTRFVLQAFVEDL